MRSFLAINALVVIALIRLSSSVLAHTAVQQVDESGLMAARAPSSILGRRSIDLGRSRLHRSRRRRSIELPKPYGTSGAALTDAENVKLLEKYVEHQSEINTAWQKQANKDIKAGKTAIQFDKFAEQYEGHPKHDSYSKGSSTDKYNQHDNYDNNADEQCEAGDKEPAGERGPTLMDKAREKAKKKAASKAQHKQTGVILDSHKGDRQQEKDSYGAGPVKKPQPKISDEHKSEQETDQNKLKSKPTDSASKSDAEKQQEDKQQQEEKESKKKEEEQRQQQKQQDQEQQKKEQQQKEKAQQQEAEKQQMEKAKQKEAAQQKKEEEQKQKEKAQKEQEKNKKEDEKQDTSTYGPPPSTGGPIAKYLGQTFSGDMTYYDVGLDACGWTDREEVYTVAVNPEWFAEFSMGDDNPNHNKICGKKIKITKNGKTQHATITDECPPCARGDLDMSQSLFESLENIDVGRCNVQWEFV